MEGFNFETNADETIGLYYYDRSRKKDSLNVSPILLPADSASNTHFFLNDAKQLCITTRNIADLMNGEAIARGEEKCTFLHSRLNTAIQREFYQAGGKTSKAFTKQVPVKVALSHHKINSLLINFEALLLLYHTCYTKKYPKSMKTITDAFKVKTNTVDVPSSNCRGKEIHQPQQELFTPTQPTDKQQSITCAGENDNADSTALDPVKIALQAYAWEHNVSEDKARHDILIASVPFKIESDTHLNALLDARARQKNITAEQLRREIIAEFLSVHVG